MTEGIYEFPSKATTSDDTDVDKIIDTFLDNLNTN